jgi:hypothetical protein
MPKSIHPDSDAKKGATEEESPQHAGNAKHPHLGGQLGHRDQDEWLKDADSDFPEPGSNPEHSGQRT